VLYASDAFRKISISIPENSIAIPVSLVCLADFYPGIFTIQFSMKLLFFSAFIILFMPGISQNLQVHYDFRHTIDPESTSGNFPGFSFEYFKNVDTAETGSFLIKVQADLNGRNQNVGQVYTQISQSLKFWDPKIYLSFNYSGGLGVTPAFYGYYLANSFGAGVAYPFQLLGAWVATNLVFRYTAFEQPSYDPQFTVNFGKGFFNYAIFISGSFVFWTENKNQGNEFTKYLSGKKFAFFGDPQFWLRIIKGLSAGTRFNVYYHPVAGGS
jgi:hypothetical protein